jgi:hypothetical protein
MMFGLSCSLADRETRKNERMLNKKGNVLMAVDFRLDQPGCKPRVVLRE